MLDSIAHYITDYRNCNSSRVTIIALKHQLCLHLIAYK
jgi:hypothetical protein